MPITNLHTALRRGLLYADSFLRLTNRQRYSMIIGKYVRDKLPYVPLLGNLPYPRYQQHHYSYSIRPDYAQRLKAEIDSRLHPTGIENPLWHVADAIVSVPRAYRRALNARLADYLAGAIPGLWEENDDDAEITCNYQRFHLFDVALAGVPNGQAQAFKLMISWIDLNPPTRNGAWDSFNCAVRLLNWIKILQGADSADFPDGGRWEKILHSVHLQLLRVRHGCRYEVPGNHVVIELFSLWLASSVFTDIEAAQEWQAYAWKELSAELDVQLLDSGFHCEHSMHYHVQVSMVAILWLCAADAVDLPVSAALQRKIYKACTLIQHFILPDGSFALFGDGCFPFFHETLRQDVENMGTLVHHAFPAEKPDDYSPANFMVTDIYPYIIATSKYDKLIADVGNIGLHNNPGHGHSDLLSFVYCSRGIPVLIDPGTRSYDNNPQSMQLKKAASHNTISLDNSDHAKLWGYFRWAYLPEKPVYQKKISPHEMTLKGQYTGFKHLGGLTHTRMLSLNGDGLSIGDTVSVTEPHELSINFILHPLISVTRIDRRSLLLTSNGHRWVFDYAGTLEPVITVSPFEIYQEYGIPTGSHKIAVVCKLDEAGLDALITIRHQPSFN